MNALLCSLMDLSLFVSARISLKGETCHRNYAQLSRDERRENIFKVTNLSFGLRPQHQGLCLCQLGQLENYSLQNHS